MKYKYIVIVLFMLLLSGCSVRFKDTKSNDGGVFISTNRGDKWKSVSYLQTANKNKGTILYTNVNNIVFDPSDSTAVYFASKNNGLFYAYDIRLGWRQAQGLPKAGVNDVDVDPNAKCTIYASVGNKVFKTTDCNRTWTQVYHDNQASAVVYTIAIDHFNDKNIYIGTNRGEVLKSIDSGGSWKVIKNIGDAILDINISPQDSRKLFVSTKDKGIFRSMDSGANWVSLKDMSMKEFKNSTKVKSLEISKKDDGLIIVATSYGMLKSMDYGDTWTRIKLITPDDKTQINDVAIDPKDSNKIYYVTNSNLYRTNDGGDTWTMRDLPTQRRGMKIIISPKNTNLIYLGVSASENKGIF